MSRRRTVDRGQATVELALGIPLVCIVALGVVQLAVVIADQIAASEIARTAVRRASVSADPESAATASVAGSHATAGVITSIGDETVSVEVSIVNRTDVPLIGLWMPDVELHSRATMVLEPP